MLDVACGCGRHMRWLAARGFAVTARRPRRRGDGAAATASPRSSSPTSRAAPGRSPAAASTPCVVTNYLWRPLLPAIVAAVAAGGVLLYETFAAGNETVGRPSRPDFLLAPR